ncbi:bifunctional 4-hydroxy-2-oxoglutarate aldolase/2-dehydro-3-deoxy-phosphogluconate aldolase [Mesorhizobium sp. IMUNJ 23232]|uniref:bifunctional 4-hydroxy-2-oxoglutarate aldolase/2-dehydro-3-deoxy-phosphogluconate aldolase n=1 Tax=Mesorhizobium sp. IMUNJ 23232 TaxID=3376064 RepID=UPI00378C7652
MAEIASAERPVDRILPVIAAGRLLPVVVLERSQDAVPLARALVEGGLLAAEVTFRTAAAAKSITAIREAVPEILVGAGTVTSLAQLNEAVAAGAAFVVTPGFNPRIVGRCLEIGMPVVPGVNAPGFVEMAMEFDVDLLKFFPAEASGGPAFITALAGPYPGIRFIPTGGIGRKNLSDYLAVKTVIGCGGSWMVDPALTAAGDFAAVARLTREAVGLAKAARP